MTQFKDIIAPLATHYWGEPNRRLSTPGRELRFGTHGSKSVDLVKGTWFDHEADEGGGAADLVRREEPGVHVVERLAAFGLPKADEIPRVETVYDYADQDGEVRYQVVRIDERGQKTYRQRHIDADGRPVWGMAGVTALPYRLPEIVNSTSAIFICEGEKAADAVAALGLVATTNHGGAGKWWPSLTQWFRARDIIVLPDNDAPGEKHARTIADSLTGTARSIRILRLPSLPPKGDAVEWLARGGTKDELIRLAKATQPYDPLTAGEPPVEVVEAASVEPSPIRIFSYDEMAHFPPVEWQVADLLPARAKTVLFGVSNAFKSFIAIDIACSVATGTPWHGHHVQQGNVLYIATEGAFGVGRKRIPAWMARHKIPANLRRNIRMITGDVVLRGDLSALISAIIAAFNGPVSLVVVDVLAGTMDGSESDDEAARDWVKAATQLVMELQAAMLVVTHSPYSDDARMRGHSHIWGSFDTRLKADGDKEARTTRLEVNRHKDHDSTGSWAFKLEEQATDEHPLETSLVPTLDDGPVETRKRPLSQQQRLVLMALEKAVEESGKPSNLPHIPRDAKVVSVSLWRQTYYTMREGTVSAKERAFARSTQELTVNQTCGIWADCAWISEGYLKTRHTRHDPT